MCRLSRLPVSVRRLHPSANLPTYAKPGDAGADLTSVAEVTLEPGERGLIPTGLAIALPEGTVGLVTPRSGLAARHGISLVNAPGVIDAGYRGEILLNLVNLDPREAFTIHVGDRVAQLLVLDHHVAEFTESDSLPPSVRGDTGHGSSGGFSGPGTHHPSKDPT